MLYSVNTLDLPDANIMVYELNYKGHDSQTDVRVLFLNICITLVCRCYVMTDS